MGRLTQKDDQGNWSLKGLPWRDTYAGEVITHNTSDRIYGALCKLRDYENTGLNPDEVEELNDFTKSQLAKTIIKLEVERKKHRWIPVEERLPEKSDFYLVSTETLLEERLVGNAWISPKDDYECLKAFERGECKITAWMPLPEPYQPKSLKSDGR